MRSLLTVVALLSIVLFGVGTAHAVLGVEDAVPGRDIVIPFICVKTATATNGTDTGWAIADAKGINPNFPPPNDAFSISLHLTVHEPTNSSIVKDDNFMLTPNDVITDNCSRITHQLGYIDDVNKAKLEVSVKDGSGVATVYYAGYVMYVQQSPTVITPSGTGGNNLVAWAYLMDLANGYAAGFNGLSMENGTTAGRELEEGGKLAPLVPVAANTIYPRYVINNELAATRTWWLLLFGRADLGTKFVELNGLSRRLQCDFYDEQETHGSNFIPIRNEFNVINVADFLSISFPCGALSSTCAHNGFARCIIQEVGTRTVGGTPQAFSSNGTVDPTGIVNTVLLNSTGMYSFFGWAHQKAQGSTVAASWDSANIIHRTYCTAGAGVTYSGGALPSTAVDNIETCACTGAGCL